MSTHAVLSPSSAHRWMACPGSIAMEHGLADTSSEHADEGTAAHELAADCLRSQKPASAFAGGAIQVGKRSFPIDDEMQRHVQTYLDTVWDFAIGGELMVEQRVDFSRYIDVPESTGTSDGIVITDDGDELQVHDLKYGRGVKVDAEQNPQLMLYALGALDLVEPLGVVPARVRLVIHQPRLEHVSEWDCTVTELLDFANKAKRSAEHAMGCITLGVDEVEDLFPGEKQCRWCKAKATCGALRDQVQASVGAEFDVIAEAKQAPPAPTEPDLVAEAMSAVGLIENWCKAVRAEAERLLLAGVPVRGWKLVEGRRGSRKWADEAEVEAALKAMRLKVEEMYDLTLISPTSAEKLAKAKTIGPRQWPKLQALITQSEGKPSVAPESDKRPALAMAPTTDEFSDVRETAEDLV